MQSSISSRASKDTFPGSPLAAQAAQEDKVIAEGWVLKKRRKKMQGFARRYFTLHQSGFLSYSFHPGEPTRDGLLLSQAAITTAPGRKDIHIDSSAATFHIKCLSGEDFNKWMSAFRMYIAADAATVGRKSSVSRTSRSGPRNSLYNRSGALVDEIGLTIAELQGAFTALLEEDSKRRQSVGVRTGQHNKEHTGPVLSLFKNRKSYHSSQGTLHEPTVDEGSQSDSSHGSPSLSLAMQRLQTGLQNLKYQHSALVQSLHAHPEGPSLRSSPLLATAKEEDEMPTPSSGYSTLGRASNRSHRLSSQSDASVWFDAEEYDGPEEFVMDDTPPEDGGPPTSSQMSEFSSPGAESSSPSNDTELDSSAGYDSDADTEDIHAEEELRAHDKMVPSTPTEARKVVRRTQLPSPPVGDEGSLFTVLKKNVGKDLAQVALPVSFNEPLTLLQRMAEEVEYFDLLGEAVNATDPIERLCLVAAFAVSGYANTRYRTGRKGFNPMLAETFEDPRMRFIAEKVCHNPVVLAYHAEGEGWELYATSSGKTKFWGKSLEIIPQGSTHLIIGNDHYEWTKPSSFMRNLMMGTKYLEHCGKMSIQNTTTGARCVLDFKESGYWGPANQVFGVVHSPDGKTVSHLEGKWDEAMAQKLDASHFRVLWRITPFPRNATEYYGFTYFGITLNEITPDLENKLPPTDSRWRPDVRALEEGNLDLAESEKARVEEMQRERRRHGEERKPRWFKKVGDEWQYVGGYWEERAKCWDGIAPLW
ncbi:oxysterol-binding protein-domain-containing protein [Phanerochaete sordida]|uniref:Oxysterol-binding protein-domain-containing protein n=1 Tax=Phanerochaete sordida TaxID=48140 RepID=A0A9P3G1H5_9APHY|nr:oxysterol-binding protein-domain-containing protein [Phanerochaete sordida]